MTTQSGEQTQGFLGVQEIGLLSNGVSKRKIVIQGLTKSPVGDEGSKQDQHPQSRSHTDWQLLTDFMDILRKLRFCETLTAPPRCHGKVLSAKGISVHHTEAANMLH